MIDAGIKRCEELIEWAKKYAVPTQIKSLELHKEVLLAMKEGEKDCDFDGFVNIILDWMREMRYGGKDGHSPAYILAARLLDKQKGVE